MNIKTTILHVMQQIISAHGAGNLQLISNLICRYLQTQLDAIRVY